jgi:hypothetical protein
MTGATPPCVAVSHTDRVIEGGHRKTPSTPPPSTPSYSRPRRNSLAHRTSTPPPPTLHTVDLCHHRAECRRLNVDLSLGWAATPISVPGERPKLHRALPTNRATLGWPASSCWARWPPPTCELHRATPWAGQAVALGKKRPTHYSSFIHFPQFHFHFKILEIGINF